uniref:Uncharacterized protein n=1 Tax=Prymnesium polylepis TaxID=72548 RepID=A0A7S4N0J3_9EUKA
MMYFTALLALVASCSGYVLPQAAPRAVAARAPSPQALAPELVLHDVASLIAEIVDGEGERVYGAVEAPGWVPIVGGIAAIGTALLPVLLAPGDEAFRGQQEDEKKVKNVFGKRD